MLGRVRRATRLSRSSASASSPSAQRPAQSVTMQGLVAVAAEAQVRGNPRRGGQQPHDGHDALGHEQLGAVQAVGGQAMDREAPRVALLFEHEQQRGAPPVRPFHQQRHVQLAEALAQARLQS